MPVPEPAVKPPYQVPGMAEIAAVPLGDDLTAVSTFSGCGGGCLGLRMAGFSVRWASEFIPAAQDTYRANFPGTPLDTRDIRQVQPAEILDAAGLEPGTLDLLEGSPPCASFSSAGKRSRGWGEIRPYSDTKQRTDDLFYEYARLLEGLQPRAFIAENVSGLVKGVAKGYFLNILARLKAAGYRVEARLVDASWLGVPQARQRIFFIGVREDLDLAPAFPKPLAYRYSVRDALPWIGAQGRNPYRYGDERIGSSDVPSPTIGTSDQGFGHETGPGLVIEARVYHDHQFDHELNDVTDRPAPTIQAGIGGTAGRTRDLRVVHDTSGDFGQGDVTDRPAPMITVGPDAVNSWHYRVTGEPEEMITRDPETGEDITIGRFAIGQEWHRMGPGRRNSDQYLNLKWPTEDQPVQTISQHGGQVDAASVTHWAQARKLTLIELRALSGFPADFVLTGSYRQRWERIGRAVPPVMMFHLATVIRDQILQPRGEPE